MKKSKKDFLYGVLYKDLSNGSTPQIVIIARDRALNLVQLWRAIYQAKTWGGFRKKAPADMYADAVSRLEEGEPSDDAPFDFEAIGGYDDWPTNPASDMLNFLPDDVKALGYFPDTAPFGDLFFTIEAERERDVLRLCKAHRWHLERNDELIKNACGDWAIAGGEHIDDATH